MTGTRGVPPWLSHLRTDRRGLPVPYVNRWGRREKGELAAIRYDYHVKSLAAFYLDKDEPEPDFTAQNMQRQRECMVRGLCQVCARPVPWDHRFLVLSGMSTERIEWDGNEGIVVTEPWLDRRCAKFAIGKCPALIRRSHGDDLTLHAITGPHDVDMVLSKGWIEGPLEAETKAEPVAMWAKLLVKNARILVRS